MPAPPRSRGRVRAALAGAAALLAGCANALLPWPGGPAPAAAPTPAPVAAPARIAAAQDSSSRALPASTVSAVAPAPAAPRGEALLRPLQFDATLDCDDGRIATLGSTGRRWVLRVDGREIPLEQARSASGARWEAVGDPSTEVWNRGPRMRLTLAGGPPADCATTAPAGGSPPGPARFVALGHEPAWRLEVDPERLRFVAGPGAAPLVVSAPAPVAAGSGRQWRTPSAAGPLRVVALDRVCTDSMSGMPFPLTLRVAAAGRDWQGCGGDPAVLLTGGGAGGIEWVAEDIDGRGVLDRARSSIAFAPGGLVRGLAGCHRYAGRWTLNGESLRLDGLTVEGTRECVPALLDQERRFLGRLGSVVRFEITPDGALRLRDARDGLVLARR